MALRYPLSLGACLLVGVATAAGQSPPSPPDTTTVDSTRAARPDSAKADSAKGDSAKADAALVDSAAGPTTLAGVYAPDQAERGKSIYSKNCTACHAAAATIGLPFKRAWGGRTLFDFFDQLRTTMPNDAPGRLSRRDYAEIVAYVLSYNGLPSGEKDLPDDDDGLKRIRIAFPPRGAP